MTLGEIVELLHSYKEMPHTLYMPELPEGSFAKKLYSTYLTYLQPERAAYGFHSDVDSLGNITELIRTLHCGQVSVNITKPGIESLSKKQRKMLAWIRWESASCYIRTGRQREKISQ